MALNYTVSYTSSHVSLARPLALTEEQKRVMYLAGRSAHEANLAADWRRHFAGLFVSTVAPNQVPYADWHWKRAHADDRDLCPCDDHPAADCETCRGACSCHYVKSSAWWAP